MNSSLRRFDAIYVAPGSPPGCIRCRNPERDERQFKKTADAFGSPDASSGLRRLLPLPFRLYPGFSGGLTMMQPKNIVKQAKNKGSVVPTCALDSTLVIVPKEPIQETGS